VANEKPVVHAASKARLADLRPHPRNYRQHPPDQITHLAYSIRKHGQYRNIVCAQDLTILGGHGVALACAEAGLEQVSIVRLPIDPYSPAALQILAGDNEVSHLAEDDDRILTELLKELRDHDPVEGLMGTGYDDMMLASLVMVTRPADEIKDMDAAAEWIGLPSFEGAESPIRTVVHHDTEEDRERFLTELGIDEVSHKVRQTWSVWWPPRPRADLKSVEFVAGGDDD
jgi:ParB-like nuclease domain